MPCQELQREDLVAKLQDSLDKLYRSSNHGLPEMEASKEFRLPEAVESVSDPNSMKVPSFEYLHGAKDNGWCSPLSPLDSPKTKRSSESKRVRLAPNNERHPCYAHVSISKINDIKSADAFFDLRIRLSLLFELDLVGAGFEKWVDAALQSSTGFLPLLHRHIELLRDLGIFFPKMVFLNAISQQEARPVEIHMYPRPEKGKLDCITWTHMWDMQFRQQFDLRHFPFDSQDLVLELSMCDSQQAHFMDRFHLVLYAVQYKQDMSNLPDWKVHRPRIKRHLPLNRRMNIHIYVSRQPQYYFWNIIFVVFMISASGFTVFMESWEKVSERVSIVLTLLLTNVTFQYNVHSQLPKLCYFTMVDNYMFRMTVALFLLSFGCCAAKFQQCLISNFGSVDVMKRWTPEHVDLLVSFVFFMSYLIAHIQWICRVLRNWSFSYMLGTCDTLSNCWKLQFGKTSAYLCFMFSYPFFLQTPSDAGAHPVVADRTNVAELIKKRLATKKLARPKDLSKQPPSLNSSAISTPTNLHYSEFTEGEWTFVETAEKSSNERTKPAQSKRSWFSLFGF